MPGQYDTRTICCDHCGDVAVECDAAMFAEELDGREDVCLGCRHAGVILVRDDEGHVWLDFHVECDGPEPDMSEPGRGEIEPGRPR